MNSTKMQEESTSSVEIESMKRYIESRSSSNSDTGCRDWQLALTDAGYGNSNWKKKGMRAHVLAYKAYHGGKLPRIDEHENPLVIRHICNNKKCVANEHLVLGTYMDNEKDKILAGTRHFGEKSVRAKISDETAIRIIASRFPKDHANYKTAKRRAEELQVNVSIVRSIDEGLSWKHLPRDRVIPIEPKRQKRICGNTSKSPHASCDEKTAKDIILSKRHKYDPSYKTQKERAAFFGVTLPVVSSIDTNETWQYLPRPEIVQLSKSAVIWDKNELSLAFERVKLNCRYSVENNAFTGTPCLIWKGRLERGRPIIKIRGKQQLAYIFACEYNEERVRPSHLVTRHLCNNPSCCEPTHLKFGTQKENSNDIRVHGTSNCLKLSLEKVAEIRRLYADEHISQGKLATQFNVTQGTISVIVRQLSWKAL